MQILTDTYVHQTSNKCTSDAQFCMDGTKFYCVLIDYELTGVSPHECQREMIGRQVMLRKLVHQMVVAMGVLPRQHHKYHLRENMYSKSQSLFYFSFPVITAHSKH